MIVKSNRSYNVEGVRLNLWQKLFWADMLSEAMDRIDPYVKHNWSTRAHNWSLLSLQIGQGQEPVSYYKFVVTNAVNAFSIF
jgi:hypothetical protein